MKLLNPVIYKYNAFDHKNLKKTIISFQVAGQVCWYIYHLINTNQIKIVKSFQYLYYKHNICCDFVNIIPLCSSIDQKKRKKEYNSFSSSSNNYDNHCVKYTEHIVQHKEQDR